MTTNAKAIASQVLEVVLFACALGLLLPPINWRPRLGLSVMYVILPAGVFAVSQFLAVTRGKTFWWAAVLNALLFAAFGLEWYRALARVAAWVMDNRVAASH
jgi:hypothetical protein